MKCSKCGLEKDHFAFATFRHRDGRVGRRGICKECRGQYAHDNFEKMKSYREAYNKKNRTRKAEDALKRRQSSRSVLDKIKSETPCADCGLYFHPVAMDFDHIHGKNKSIASMVSQAYKLEIILEEIKLCEIVCACCHRIRTHNRKQNIGRP